MARRPASTRQYLAETFAPRSDADELRAQSERIHAMTATLAGRGDRIRYLHSLLAPREETAFHFFEAEQPAVVELALQGAGLEPERISAVIRAAGNGALATGNTKGEHGSADARNGLRAVELVPLAPTSPEGDEEDA